MTKRSVKRAVVNNTMSFPCRCAVDIGITLSVGMLLLLLSAAIAYAQPDPAILAKPLALLSIYLSVFIGGVLAGNAPVRPILCALLCSSGVILALMLLSLLPYGKSGSSLSPLLAVGMYAGVCAVFVAGALARMKMFKKRVAHHKKHRRR